MLRGVVIDNEADPPAVMVGETVAVVPLGVPVTVSEMGAANLPINEPHDKATVPSLPAGKASVLAAAAKVQDGAATVTATGQVRLTPPPVAVRVAV